MPEAIRSYRNIQRSRNAVAQHVARHIPTEILEEVVRMREELDQAQRGYQLAVSKAAQEFLRGR